VFRPALDRSVFETVGRSDCAEIIMRHCEYKRKRYRIIAQVSANIAIIAPQKARNGINNRETGRSRDRTPKPHRTVGPVALSPTRPSGTLSFLDPRQKERGSAGGSPAPVAAVVAAAEASAKSAAPAKEAHVGLLAGAFGIFGPVQVCGLVNVLRASLIKKTLAMWPRVFVLVGR
jgi:hypothetical protein